MRPGYFLRLIPYSSRHVGLHEWFKWFEATLTLILKFSVPCLFVESSSNIPPIHTHTHTHTHTYIYIYIQGGAEPTDTFQMVIDNIWKQGKICETVCKYVQVRYLLPTNYKLIF